MHEFTRRIRPIDLSPEPLPDDPIEQLIKNMARDGWEVATTSPFDHKGEPHVVIIFRREVESTA